MEVDSRERVLKDMKSAYGKYATARKMRDKYTASGQSQKASEWTGKMRSAERDLELAYKKLPEVQHGATRMNAVTFAESLVTRKPPKHLPAQTDFLGP